MNDADTVTDIYKAQDLGTIEVDSRIIRIGQKIPDTGTLEEMRGLFMNDAAKLFEALTLSLTGGTIDQLLVLLLQNKASMFTRPSVDHAIRDAARAECNRLLEENRKLRSKFVVHRHDPIPDEILRAFQNARRRLMLTHTLNINTSPFSCSCGVVFDNSQSLKQYEEHIKEVCTPDEIVRTLQTPPRDPALDHTLNTKTTPMSCSCGLLFPGAIPGSGDAPYVRYTAHLKAVRK